MAVAVAVTEGFSVRFLQVSEQSSLTAIAKEHSIPYQTLMALQQNNRALHHTVILERFCSTTESSRPLSLDEQPDRQQKTTAFGNAKPPRPLALRFGPPSAQLWQAKRLQASMAQIPRPAEVLVSACTSDSQANPSPDDEFALKLYWGRQRGLAVIFATDASACASRESERVTLGKTLLERTAVVMTPERGSHEDAACIISSTPLPKMLGDNELPHVQADVDGEAGLSLLCRKLVIPEDACSVDGPPTPDNEEADRLCMPAAKRPRLKESPPPAAAAAVAGTLHLL